ncbi:MAG: right-handed parallel beta-helix repeat-containing protein [Candidatus Dadabacteria bacterium]|nr:MAG: right-handed parallel beta-helix repeat-containing protein [Candidatus Dadabacteria bacterium]
MCGHTKDVFVASGDASSALRLRRRIQSRSRNSFARVGFVLFVGWLVFLLPARSFAKECGDDIGGHRIACDCGDTVVSNTTLRPNDPIVAGRCRGDGLEIEADDMAETLVLELDGRAIVGSGSGVGIEIESGGSEGAVVIGGHDGERGQVVAFNIGVRARNPRAIRRIQSLDLKGNRHEGLWLRTNGTMVIDVRAVRNSSDGLRVMGRGGRLIGIEARENGGSGLRSYAYDLIIDARAVGNKLHGIALSGYRNELGDSVAEDNGGYGVIVTGNGHDLTGVVASGNRLGAVKRRQGGILR